jgi:hypothetical protein
MQYLHPKYSFSHLVFCFCFLISDVVAPPPIALKGVHWVMDGPKFAFRVDGCDASYMAKYNLVVHLRVCHNVTMELGKLRCPSIQEEGSKHENHVTMNMLVLNNPLAWFCHNEQKVIARGRRHTNLEWDRFQVALQHTPKVPKPTLIKLAYRHILQLLGITTWGVGAIPFNV